MKNWKKLTVILAYMFIIAITACDNETTKNTHTHEWGEWEGDNAPTCNEGGSGTRICIHNEEHTQTDNNIPALGHNNGEWYTIQESTYIEVGSKELRCTRCNVVLDTDIITILPITKTECWNTALSQLNGKTGDYIITINGNVGISGNMYNNTFGTFGTTPTGSCLSVTIQGNGKLYLISQGNIISIGENQIIIIDSTDLTIEGLTNGKNNATQNNNTFMVNVYGTFELKNGKISGNSNNDHESGVLINQNGKFIMNGGEISGNTTNMSAAGVSILEDGTFIMNGGKITNNNGGWGGMFVAGTFIMNGGEISGNNNWGAGIENGTFLITNGIIYGENEANENLRNTGGSVYFYSGTFQYGTFTETTWSSKGNLSTSNNTIMVVDGMIQH